MKADENGPNRDRPAIYAFMDIGALREYSEGLAASIKREPLIPAGAPLDHVPVRKT